MYKHLFFFTLLISLTCNGVINATHNRAGEITYVQTGPLTIECTITTYTKNSSTDADRDSLIIQWGDGDVELIGRNNGPQGKGEILGNDIKKNIYIASHTYPGRGTFTIATLDPNRIGGIRNIPNSVNIPFYLETTFTLLNPQFQGSNSSVILLQPPIDVACLNQPFVHNPNAYDADQDSLAFELVFPFQDKGSPVTGYKFPDRIVPGPNNKISLDPITGTFIWDAPQKRGDYNIAIKIKEYRNGVLINSVIRDMQISVKECEDNTPPFLNVPPDVCVIAGTIISFDIIANDTNTNPLQKVLLSATGSPFLLDKNHHPATFTSPNNHSKVPVLGHFEWQTSCEHISDSYYTIVFHAVDDFDEKYGLSTLQTFRIKVVGPPPQNVNANNSSGDIKVTWDKPYVCDDVIDDYFIGFSVWRRENSKYIPFDTCLPGLSNQGYEIIQYLTTLNNGNHYEFTDQNTEKGKTYCYRILANFANKTDNGTPYNIVESLSSEETCILQSRNLPLITNVDVLETDPFLGEILIRWTKPDAIELDTLQHPGPYIYELYFENSLGNFTPILGAQFVSPTFNSSIDTHFIHKNLNTTTKSFNYKISLSSGQQPQEFLGFSAEASSIFTKGTGLNERVSLNWAVNVPWNNFEFIVLRKNNTNGYDSIGVTTENIYIDPNTENNVNYCYIIKSHGNYGSPAIPQTLINHSQETCLTPIDNDPPCIPTIKVLNACMEDAPDLEDFTYNQLLWEFDLDDCDEEEPLGFHVYYSNRPSESMILIGTITTNNSSWDWTHTPIDEINGCYSVSAFDSLGNESERSKIICVENCPDYKLPNTFTPNDDGQNDLFKPYPYRFVDHVDFEVYNQWGEKVFQTFDPDLNWNGSNIKGKNLAAGVYYYTCRVFENGLLEVKESNNILKGYIELIK